MNTDILYLLGFGLALTTVFVIRMFGRGFGEDVTDKELQDAVDELKSRDDEESKGFLDMILGKKDQD